MYEKLSGIQSQKVTIKGCQNFSKIIQKFKSPLDLLKMEQIFTGQVAYIVP